LPVGFCSVDASNVATVSCITAQPMNFDHVNVSLEAQGNRR
jgi:hypothetical protein